MSAQTGAYRVALTAATDNTAGAVASIANPEGAAVLITRAVIYTTTASTGAATLDIGVAANGSTSSDTLFDGLDVNAAAGVFDNVDDQGTNGKQGQYLAAGKWITGSATNSKATGLAGTYYITYTVA